MSDIRQKIAKTLIINKLGATHKEIAETYKIKPLVILGTLGQMMNAGLVEKGEKLEIEGQLYLITEKGLLEFGSKIDLNEKEESPLEQIESEPVVKESLTAEIEDFETRAPFSNDEIESFKISKQAKVNTDNFKVWQIIDDMGEKFVELLSQSKAKPIENIDYKIATLNLLADTDIYNQKISATLRAIAADLRA